MKSRMIFTLLNLVFALACFPTNCSTAAESFLDDFTNPSPSDPDRAPVTWRATYGNIAIEGGDLVISADSSLAGAFVNDFVAKDVTIEAQFRIVEGSNAALALRGVGAAISDCYYGELSDGNARLYRCGVPVRPLSDAAPVDFNATDKDVVMRLQVLGDQLSLWAWPADEERPTDPLATARNSSLTEGTVGFTVYDLQSGPVQAEVRYFQAIVVPEPSAGLLSLLGLLGGVMWFRQKHSQIRPCWQDQTQTA